MKNSRRSSGLPEPGRGDIRISGASIEKFIDEDMDERLFEHDPKVIREARTSYERVKQGGGITLEQLRSELGV